MKLVIRRRAPIGDALPSDAFVDGKLYSFALERLSEAIPAGTYPLVVTVSKRATDGRLWSPDLDHRLPLVMDVPGRDGIRIHAANDCEELEGCIALGQRRAGPQLINSRAVVGPFFTVLDHSAGSTITIVDPPAVPEAAKA